MTTTDTREETEQESDEGAAETGPSMTRPIILDLGKRGKKTVKRLRKGRGAAMAEVNDVLEQVQAELGDEVGDKVLLPVVVMYGRKRRRRRGPW